MTEEPDANEFVRFMTLLTDSTPDEYDPWLFRVEAGSKAPDTSYGSWKKESARLKPHEAIEWMEDGGNVGIAGTPDDPLVNVDIDDEDETTIDDLKPTLIARSRSRTGVHAWYFEAEDGEIPNIPTDAAGEIRANWQYVVAPGSYVETDPSNVPENHREKAGYYTVEHANPVAEIAYDELPDVFANRHEEAVQADAEPELEEDTPEIEGGDGQSALFDIDAGDVVAKEGGHTDPGDRWGSLFHGSDTGANMSLSNEGLLQCWRHEVAHNGLQALTVLSDYRHGCERVGSGHKRSGAGGSCINNGDEHIWHAWKYAKENGYIPDDDRVPYRALCYLARNHELCAVTEIPKSYNPEEGERLPAEAYDAAISIIENHYEIDSGRKKTAEIDDKTEKKPSPGDETGKVATTDGGTTTADTAGGGPSEPDWGLAPWAVMQAALDDEYGRLERAEDSEDNPTIHDLRKPEAATYVWDVMENAGKDDVLYTTGDVLRAYENGVWDEDGEQRLREYGRQALRAKYSGSIRDELEEQTKARQSYHPEELGAPDGTFATENGLLHLLDGDLEDLKRDHHAIRRANVDYDPDAPEPERWLEFVRESIPKEADRMKFQEYCGYTLWHHAQPFGKALFLVGPTDSGKGTALKVVREILGEDNVGNESLYELIQTDWGPAQIHDKAVNIRNEVTPGGLNNVQRFKELTGGGDRISAQFKNKSKFRFTVTQKFLFATNEVPQIQAADEAFYNRCLFVRFPRTVPEEEQDPNLLEKLTEEKPGILNWMLEGLQRLMEQEGFTAERDTGAKKEICNAFGSVVERFTHRCLEVTGDKGDAVAKADLYDLAQEFADAIDKDPEWNAQSGFTRMLKDVDAGISDGQTRIDGSNTKVFMGVRLRGGLAEDADTEVRTVTGDDGDGDSPGQQSLV